MFLRYGNPKRKLFGAALLLATVFFTFGHTLLSPSLAVVIFGGLISSTIVSLIFTPSVFYHFRHHDMPKLESILKKIQKVTDQ